MSCSVKFASPLKSLNPNGLVAPDCGLNAIDIPESGVPVIAVLVRVIVCVVGTDPTICAGKLRNAGEREIGCEQLLVFPIARHTFPISPARFPPGHELVLIAYPNAPSRTVPEAEDTTVTGEGLEKPWGAPIWPAFNPFVPMTCKISELPLICPFTDADFIQG